MILFDPFYCVLFVVPGYVTRNLDVTRGIPFDRHVQDSRLAIAYYVLVATAFPWRWELSVYHAFASGHSDKPRMNNTSGFLFGGPLEIFFHNGGR
jgi:hypothetical protein